eukprot:Sspe_Gene.117368::Locus_108501_Transcript_1_1_Confidence_1.000_Length_1046::g.117368::m.117368
MYSQLPSKAEGRRESGVCTTRWSPPAAQDGGQAELEAEEDGWGVIWEVLPAEAEDQIAVGATASGIVPLLHIRPGSTATTGSPSRVVVGDVLTFSSIPPPSLTSSPASSNEVQRL